jgi:radical SAM superfamily enzyme YgiQ (UPF0313 family)
MMKKKLLLINPVNIDIPLISSNLFFKYPPIALSIISKLTPADWDIEIVDENFETFNYRPADLIGITALTCNVNRAYEIAREYLHHKIPVVMGGIHVSMMPEEAIQYCNSVIIGDAEDTWSKVISDIENQSLQKFYHSNYPDLKSTPLVDHSIFDERYPFACIQTSRGCPFDCDFCSVHTFNKSTYRRRPLENVMQEIESIKDKNKLVFFIDDNLTGTRKEDTEYVKNLFREIIKQKIKINWFCQVSADIIRDEELIELASKSGCKIMVIGIESETEESLKDIHKPVNIKYARDKYHEVIRKIHKHGILISAMIIFGMEHDTVETLTKRMKFALQSNFDIVQITPLTPLPGTKLFKKISDENRLLYNKFPQDWSNFNIFQVVFQPKNLSNKELSYHIAKANNKLYNKPRIYFRFFKSLFATHTLNTALWGLRSNFNYRNIFYKKDFLMIDQNEIPNTGIFFITGRPRSGTTLLRSLLDAHQNIVVPYELTFIIDLYPRYGHYKNWDTNTKKSFFNDLTHQPLINFWDIDPQLFMEKFLNTPSDIDYSYVCKFVYLQFKSLMPKQNILLIGDKNPIYTIHVNRLLRIFPEAKFIHITREYKDQISSMLNVNFEKPLISSLAYRWKYFNKIIQTFKEEHPESVFFLKYEDLVKNPEIEMKKVFNYLSVPYNENIFEFYKVKDDFVKTYSKEKVEKYHKELFQPINTSRIGTWLQNIDERKVKKIEAIIGRDAETFGYERKYKKLFLQYKISAIPGIVYGMSYYLIYKLIYNFPIRIKRKIILSLDRSLRK